MKKIFKVEYLIGIILMSFLFPIQIPVTFTGMGILTIYFAVILYIFPALLFLYKLFKHKLWKEKIVITYLGICIWYLFLFIYRFATKQYFYHSLEMAFWVIVPVSFFILLIFDELDYLKTIKSLFYAISFVNVYLFIYHVFIIKQLRSSMLGNINIVVFFCIISIFISSYYYLNLSTQKIDSFLYVFNMFYSLFAVLLSGSRAGVLVGVSSFLLLAIYYIRNKKFRKSIFITILLTAVVISYFVSTNIYGSRFYLARGFNYSTIGTSISESKNFAVDDNIGESTLIQDAIKKANQNGDAEAVQVLNDMGRIFMWKSAVNEIKKSPLIGTGLIGIYKTAEGSQTAHNFLLEYWLAFGGIGVLIWIIFIVQILILIYKKTSRNRAYFFYILLVLFSAAAFSFVEPTLSSAVGPFIVWCSLGVLVSSVSKSNT